MILRMRNNEEDVTMWAIFLVFLPMRNYEEDVTWWVLIIMILRMRRRCYHAWLSDIPYDSAHAKQRRRCHSVSDIPKYPAHERNYEKDVNVWVIFLMILRKRVTTKKMSQCECYL